MTKEIDQTEAGNERLEKIVELSMLYDFYGECLKEHKKQIFADYVLNDLSLSEIAEEQGISRQGVYDCIKRCSKELMEYEEKLGLIRKFEHTKSMVGQIKELSKQLETELTSGAVVTEDCLSKITTIDRISEEILENF